MKQDPIQNHIRETRRENKLGEDACCFLCPESELAALRPVSRRFLEDHHVVGKAHDGELTVPLCRNCHYKLTEDLRQVGASMEPTPSPLDRLLHFFRALGAFFRRAADACFSWAEQLADLIRKLDAKVPEWRAAAAP